MKRYLVLILIICCQFGFSQSFVIEPTISKDYQINFSQNNPNIYQLQFDINRWELSQVSKENIDYQMIKFESSTVTQDKGWAELPFISASVQLPANKDVDLHITATEFIDIPLTAPLLPSRGTIYRDQDPTTIPYQIAAESVINQFYPTDLATMESPFIIRDVRGTSVRIFPFQYNAVTNTLRVYTHVEVELVENDQPAHNPLTCENRHPLKEAVGMYESIFMNFEPSRYDLPLSEYGDILVITTPAYETAITPFIQWKKEKGYNVSKQVVSAGTNVKSLIQTEYNNNNNIMFVQLVGDWTDIKSDASVDNAPTDPKMGCVVGSDNYPDISIGRFSCSTSGQLTDQVDKAINYEKNPNMDANWRETFIGVASDEGSGTGDDSEIDYTHVQRIYSERLDGFTYNTHQQNYAPNESASDLSSYLNQGASTLAYCGHGAETYFVTTGFSNSNIANLSNGDKLPFIVSVACVNGAFHNSSDCFAEAWLKKQNGGAVVTWMSTINQPWTPPQRGQDYFYDILIGGFNYDGYSGQNGINTTEQRTHWGCITVNSANLMLAESSTTDDVETVQTWTTFGDASLQLRTKQPDQLSLSNTTVMSGIPFTATVSAAGTPIANALVCISQNDVYYKALSDANGNISITHDFTPGNVLLVASAFNTTTIYQDVNCVSGNVPYLTVADYSPEIVTYNSNPFLTISLRNDGGVATTEYATVVISCNDPLLTITDNTDYYASMSANGGTASVANGFQLSVANNVETGHQFTISVSITLGDDAWNNTILLTALGSDCDAPTGLSATANNNNVLLTWNDNSSVETITYEDDAESHTAFSINSPGTLNWSYIDGDGASTFTYNSIQFTNEGSAMAYIVMNMAQTTGTGIISAHSGDQFFGCAGANGSYYNTVSNNDWMISPELNYTEPFIFSFYARSFSSSYANETFYATYSTTGTNESDFTNLTSSAVTSNANWQLYSYTVPATAKYVAIHCTSNDQYMFCVDDISISGQSVMGNTYNIYRNGELIASNVIGGTYTDPNLADGTYCYTITSNCPANFESLLSNSSCATIGGGGGGNCDAPGNLTTTPSQMQIGLVWTPSANAVAYKVFRDNNLIQTTSATNYTDTDVSRNTEYCYTVSAVCTNGESGMSNTACSSLSGIEENQHDNLLRIYPNPVSDQLVIEGSNVTNITIYSTIGTKVYESDFSNNALIINVNNWSGGIYFIKATYQNGESVVKKVVVR
ncbi:MAG TPA: C25 family cysteine peptidase [Bacteroidales bacterium]|nr:C25 family cysteine peptidase [Bacteroidales bacterium]